MFSNERNLGTWVWEVGTGSLSSNFAVSSNGDQSVMDTPGVHVWNSVPSPYYWISDIPFERLLDEDGSDLTSQSGNFGLEHAQATPQSHLELFANQTGRGSDTGLIFSTCTKTVNIGLPHMADSSTGQPFMWCSTQGSETGYLNTKLRARFPDDSTIAPSSREAAANEFFLGDYYSDFTTFVETLPDPRLHNVNDTVPLQDLWDTLWNQYASTSGPLSVRPGADFMLSRAEFVSDCEAAVEQVCGQMNARTAPFACIRENVIETTALEALSVALANTQFFMGILFAVLAIMASKLNGATDDARARVGASQISVNVMTVSSTDNGSEGAKVSPAKLVATFLPGPLGMVLASDSKAPVHVKHVDAGSQASEQGVMEGSVFLTIAGRSVADFDKAAVMQALTEAERPMKILFELPYTERL